MGEVKVFSTIDELNSISKQWKDLFKQSSSSPFQSPSWLLPWYKYFGFGDLRVFTIWENKSLKFIAPLFIRKLKNEDERKLVFIGTGNTDYLDCIYNNASPDYFDSLFVYIGDKKGQWDVCDLSDIPSTSPLINYLNAECYETCPVLDINTNIETYLRSTFTRKRLYNTRRMERILKEEGNLLYELVIYDDKKDPYPFTKNEQNTQIEDILNDFIQLHKKRWLELSSLSNSSVKDFLFETVTQLYKEGYAKFFLLRHNNKMLAADLVFVKDGHLYDYLICYDPVYEKYSPGFILKLKMIEWCYRNNIHHFDFLKGKEEYKYSFGAKDTSTFRINIPSR